MEKGSGSKEVDDIVNLYGGWKGANISRLRTIIKAADPEVVEEVKWRMRTRPEGLPVWSHNGIMCLLETFKNDQKLVFTKGAQMDDLKQHFNARLNGKTDRAIELHEGDDIDEATIKALIQEAAQINDSKTTS